MRYRCLLLATAFAAAVMPAFARDAAVHRAPVRQAGERGVAVPMDEVRTITFATPVATVYVGNPVIADVTMIDARHAFVLGKQYGGTNIIALDRTGAQISNQHVTVFAGSASSVTFQRGPNQITYACASSRCEAAPVPGDGKDAFANAMDQITKHQDMGAHASDAK